MPKIIPIENIEDIRNKVTSLEGSLTDEQYPSAKAVSDALTNCHILNDRITGTRYRLYIHNGEIKTEVVE